MIRVTCPVRRGHPTQSPAVLLARKEQSIEWTECPGSEQGRRLDLAGPMERRDGILPAVCCGRAQPSCSARAGDVLQGQRFQAQHGFVFPLLPPRLSQQPVPIPAASNPSKLSQWLTLPTPHPCCPRAASSTCLELGGSSAVPGHPLGTHSWPDVLGNS